MTTSSGAAIAENLSRIESVLEAAQRLLDEGRVVDISALEARTEQMCAEVLALPPAESRGLRSQLEALLARFDALAEALRARFGDLPVLPTARGATAAYAALLKHFP
jgi:hypothetical protein